MEVGAFYLPSVGRKEEIIKGMAGKRTDLYQNMLKELSEQICYMDEHGYYGAGFTEHHFHIEGEEVSTNPVILDLYFGMQTQRMKFGQLGNVLRRVGMDPTIAKYGEFYQPGIEKVADFFTAARFREQFGNERAEIITSIAMFYDLEEPLAFVRDIAAVLSPTGIWYFEQSYLPTMMEQNAYDTICHEHLEYYALAQVQWMLSRCGLRVLDAQLNDVNGGSFSIAACRDEAPHQPNRAAIDALVAIEKTQRLDTMEPYRVFARRVADHRTDLLETLAKIRAEGATILGYGASTKGNVILQYCGLTTDDIPAMAEVNPDKFGALTPGTNIPIISEQEAHARNPDYFLVMPWHFRENLIQREAEFLRRGGKMLFPLPEISIVAS